MTKRSAFILVLLSLLLYKFFVKPTLSALPLPYQFVESSFPMTAFAQKADILLLGDRFALKINTFNDYLSQQLNESFDRTPSFFNWGSAYEGSHRQLQKLKSLKKFPAFIILFSGSEEYAEKIFRPKDSEKILTNLAHYKMLKQKPLIKKFPFLAKIFLKSYPIEVLRSNKYNEIEYSAVFKQKQIQTQLALYNYHLEEIISLIKKNNSKLVLITSPLNLFIAPKRICENSTNKKIEQALLNIKQLILTAPNQQLYRSLYSLQEKIPQNAKAHYLYGDLLQTINDQNGALLAWQKSTVYDCQLWRSNYGLNNIVRNLAKKNNVLLIDFDFMINKKMTGQTSFDNDIFPNEFYFKKLIKNLIQLIRLQKTY